jgi:release factor glutamine methyltransferase
MFALMTNMELYRQYLQYLQSIYSSSEAAVITDWVFEKLVGLKRADLIKNPGQSLNTTIETQLNQSLEALLQHKPVQYVLGEAWFYKMKLIVNEEVLIPRPETEELVQLVIDDYGFRLDSLQTEGSGFTSAEAHPISMLDIGTGSGCIAVALKKSLPDIRMHAIDISVGALSVAKINAMEQQADIQFLQVDFLNEGQWKQLPVFDVIISNPPYIPFNEKDKMDKNVTAFEPHTALFVPDKTPLLFYEKIAAFGKKHLQINGKIYVEIMKILQQAQ